MRTDHVSRITLLTALLLTAACGGGGGASAATGTTSGGGGGGGGTSVANVTVTSNASNLTVGSSMAFTGAAKDANGNGVTAAFNWNSSSETIAFVRSSGLVYGISAGTATITATSGAASGSKVLTVAAPSGTPNSAFVITVGNTFFPNNVTITQGGSVTFLFGPTTHDVDYGTTTGRPSNIGDTQNSDNVSTFNTKGTFPYICILHAGMVGTITVI